MEWDGTRPDGTGRSGTGVGAGFVLNIRFCELVEHSPAATSITVPPHRRQEGRLRVRIFPSRPFSGFYGRRESYRLPCITPNHARSSS